MSERVSRSLNNFELCVWCTIYAFGVKHRSCYYSIQSAYHEHKHDWQITYHDHFSWNTQSGSLCRQAIIRKSTHTRNYPRLHAPEFKSRLPVALVAPFAKSSGSSTSLEITVLLVWCWATDKGHRAVTATRILTTCATPMRPKYHAQLVYREYLYRTRATIFDSSLSHGTEKICSVQFNSHLVRLGPGPLFSSFFFTISHGRVRIRLVLVNLNPINGACIQRKFFCPQWTYRLQGYCAPLVYKERKKEKKSWIVRLWGNWVASCVAA